MSVSLGEDKGFYLHGVLCEQEFTQLPLIRSCAMGVQVYQKCTKQQLAPHIRVLAGCYMQVCTQIFHLASLQGKHKEKNS